MTTKPKESTKALNDKLDFDELSKPEQREMIARLEEQMKKLPLRTSTLRMLPLYVIL